MEILKKVKSLLPTEVVDRINLEGCEIVIYTKDKLFFLDASEQVKDIVSQLKKRIEVRPDISLCMSTKDAEKKIMDIVPEDAKVSDVTFEPERSVVVITAEKPGLVIGKGGETFKKIRKETLWVPRIERIPEIKSKYVMAIRKLLQSEIKWRTRFLNKVGKNIFSDRETKRDWVRLTCLGGYREVGRSCTLVETPKSKVLMDCGVNVGGVGQNSFPYLHAKEFDPAEIDAVIISHPHLDHMGMVPYLFEYGYDGPFYCTPPCLDVFTMLCLDYIDVLQRNGVNPPYTAKGIKEAVKHSITLDYNEVSDVAPDIRLTFQNAGHLLGSSLVHLHVGQGLHNIVYTGDLKYGKTQMFDPAFTGFQRIETLIMESTYGGQDDIMPPREQSEKQLMDIIDRTMERKGSVLIPSFAVGRGQEVMAILAQSNFEYPVYIDGMIWDATSIHTAYPEYLSKGMERLIFQGENPLTADIFKHVASPADRAKVKDAGPCVIVSTSGMLSGGPVIEHLKVLGEDSRNSLIFVGYQGEGTLGRRIQKGWREIPINNNGRNTTMKMGIEVETIEGLSGHSDRNQLLNYVHRLRDKPERVIICHGDGNKPLNLARTLHKMIRMETLAPKNLETIRLK